MAAQPPTPPTKKPITDILVVLYGPEAVGKSTTALKAPGRIYVIDCGGGLKFLDFPNVTKKRVTSFKELEAEVKFLRTGRHNFTTAVLDRPDQLYYQEVEADENKTARPHIGAQAEYNPALLSFAALPLLKIVTMNSRVIPDFRAGSVDIMPSLPRRPREHLCNAADFVLYCYNEQGGDNTTRCQAKANTTGKERTYAKSLSPLIRNGQPLATLWSAFGQALGWKMAADASAPPPPLPAEPEPEPEERPAEPDAPITLPTTLDAAVPFLNDRLGQVFFKAPTHLANVLRKHGDGVPADGDEKGWTQAVAVALDYARGQLDAPPTPSTQQPALAIAAN